MRAKMDRRSVFLGLMALPGALVATLSGCGVDPNQHTNGTMVKPSDLIEKRAELRARKQDALDNEKKTKKKT